MLVTITVTLVILGPLLCGIGVGLLYRRTGHSVFWQVAGMMGSVIGIVVLNLPTGFLPVHPTQYQLPMAVAFGFFVPAALSLLLALKRWPTGPNR